MTLEKDDPPLNIVQIFELGPTDSGLLMGGVENHVWQMSKALIKQGHNVSILTGAIPKNQEKITIQGVNIYRIELKNHLSNSYRAQQLTYKRQLFFLLASNKVNFKLPEDFVSDTIFHGHVYSSGLAAYNLAKKHKSYSFNTIHGSYYNLWEDIGAHPLRARLMRRAERSLATFLANNCTGQTHTDYDFALRTKNWISIKKREYIRTILNGVNPDQFDPSIKPASLNLKTDNPVIMTTRRLVKKNGVKYLIKAFAKIQKEMDAELVIIGDGPEKSSLKQLAIKLGVETNCSFFGIIPNIQIAPYLLAADVLIVPSLVEASSISVLEGMAMEKTIIATDIPGIREITQKGRYAKLVQAQSAHSLKEGILEVLSDVDSFKEHNKQARLEILNSFTWDAKARELASFYIKAISKR
jgi:glycosyltransferase involved in cell wall biosynthesis